MIPCQLHPLYRGPSGLPKNQCPVCWGIWETFIDSCNRPKFYEEQRRRAAVATAKTIAAQEKEALLKWEEARALTHRREEAARRSTENRKKHPLNFTLTDEKRQAYRAWMVEASNYHLEPHDLDILDDRDLTVLVAVVVDRQTLAGLAKIHRRTAQTVGSWRNLAVRKLRDRAYPPQ